MLEVTVLKVQHKGIGGARKMLPHIQACDVFCPEMPWATEDKAGAWENGYEQALRLQRTAFLRIVEQNLSHIDDTMRPYFIKQYDYLYKSQRPIWILERATPEEYQAMREVHNQSKAERAMAYKHLVRSELDEYLNHCWRSIQLQAETFTIRDAIIGKILDTSETRIRERYPQLRDKDVIQLTASIGALHTFEDHTVLDCTPIPLYEPPVTVQDRFDWTCGKSFEEAQPDILAHGVLYLSQQDMLELSEPEIRKMDIAELENAVQSFHS